MSMTSYEVNFEQNIKPTVLIAGSGKLTSQSIIEQIKNVPRVAGTYNTISPDEYYRTIQTTTHQETVAAIDDAVQARHESGDYPLPIALILGGHLMKKVFEVKKDSSEKIVAINSKEQGYHFDDETLRTIEYIEEKKGERPGQIGPLDSMAIITFNDDIKGLLKSSHVRYFDETSFGSAPKSMHELIQYAYATELTSAQAYDAQPTPHAEHQAQSA